MRSLLSLLLLSCCCFANAQQTIIKYLSGTDKDHTVNWDFFCTEGAKSGSWTKIPVPSNWEMQGFGGYNYGHDKNKHKEHGLYKCHFTADKNWGNKQVELVFAGVMTDVEVKINGQVIGPIHQGGFYEFSYNITPFIKPGADNLLEADVSKMSADSSVNRAEREGDFWVFGGIYRPVYLKILPQTFIERVAIDAKADGNFNMDIYFQGLVKGDKFVAQVKTLQGEKIGLPFSTIAEKVADKFSLSNFFSKPQTWNPEFPKLYKVEVSIVRNNKILHTIQQRFGFRTVEVRKGDGIYLNNTKVILKGVNRHSSWPESGRTLSRKIHLMDIGLMKDMNMNAVRMSHYPPDVEFLDLCDSLGLFVLDELTGWQKKYATPIGRKLVKELVVRDVNHPSIIFWDNGNEGGFNFDLDNDYALYDPQQRTVLHPWSNFNNVDTKHYPDYSYIEKAAAKDDILLHTEMIHGLYDGGHGAGLEDYWNLMRKNPHHAGGFLWVLADEGIVRHDKHDSIDTYGNNAPDGIVGPHREKEGSYYTIKELWSPVQVRKPVLDKSFDGKIEIENDYHYTNLSVCKFNWQLIKYPFAKDTKTGHTVIASGKASIQLDPGKKGSIKLSLPPNWNNADALIFSATDVYGRELYTWTWAIKTPQDVSTTYNLQNKLLSTLVIPEEKIDGNTYSILQGNIRYDFNITTGMLQTVVKKDKIIPFGNGPILADEKQTLQKFTHKKDEVGYVVEATYIGRNALNVKWSFRPNSPAELEYTYTQKDTSSFYGIVFNTDESKITGMKWLGGGPFHVWKNRLKGATIDVWHKKYNNTITGETFEYPEFKGYHADMYWATIENTVSPFTVYTNMPGLYLQMLNTPKQKTNFNPFVNPPFPKGNIGFLNGIPAIGTKFKGAETMGPQSQKNAPVAGVISGSLWFDFR
ncbi:MAG: glycoside hydrolase family 2 TIM barrel-domain containing protein [Bacteroidota bacterium]